MEARWAWSVGLVRLQLLYQIGCFAVLAVGRCDGGVSLHDVEKGDTLHSFSVNSKVTYMNWIQVDLIE